MYLVQILLPLLDISGEQFSKEMFNEVRTLLLREFGGVTFYHRNAATGLWEDSGGEIEKDEVIIVEVMVNSLDRNWWKNYRKGLEEKFNQDEIVIRAIEYHKL
jgi:hypothetical protein